MKKAISRIPVPKEFEDQWQDIIDIIARLFSVPASLIMRLVDEDIKVFLSSRTEGNPYHVGDKEHFNNSGLYCETVIKTEKLLLVPNALEDEKWMENPDVKINMISYMGLPIKMPNNEYFGTICVLDNHKNLYSPDYIDLMKRMRKVIEKDLELIWANRMLGGEKNALEDYINELKSLRKLIPICSKCKSIRNDEGYWNSIEEYLSKFPGTNLTHSLCNDCAKELYGEGSWLEDG